MTLPRLTDTKNVYSNDKDWRLVRKRFYCYDTCISIKRYLYLLLLILVRFDNLLATL